MLRYFNDPVVYTLCSWDCMSCQLRWLLVVMHAFLFVSVERFQRSSSLHAVLLGLYVMSAAVVACSYACIALCKC